MQSFRQYREIGRRVAAQYESKGKPDTKTAQKPLAGCGAQERDINSLRNTGFENNSSPALPPPPHDLEKGENGSQRLEGEPGVVEPAGENPEEKEEEAERPSPGRLMTVGTNIVRSMTGIDVRKRTTKEGGGDQKVFVVGFQGDDDPLNPHTWSYTRRIWIM